MMSNKSRKELNEKDIKSQVIQMRNSIRLTNIMGGPVFKTITTAVQHLFTLNVARHLVDIFELTLE